uniref:HpcH/HpaI aldolase/citrate lyase domain-containing protein n=2 Tax=Opuntia streptacantha TaxID=393608 RepID=A0A7C9DDC8_OPUST
MSTLLSPTSSLLSLQSPSPPKSNPLSLTPSPPTTISIPSHHNYQPHFQSHLFKSLKTSSKTLIIPSATSADYSSSLPRPPSLKSRLNNGETLYGLFLCSFCPTLAEIAGFSGYDFVVVDMEHGYGGISEALDCLRALAGTLTPAILRLPETSPMWAKKALDLGPQGIMFPMIENAKDAKKAVSYCRFPPNGVRGAAHPIIRASGYGIESGYLNSVEEDLLIMCQVESEDAAEKAADIAAVEGVDCIQMGPLDLSASMGYLWDPGNKKVREMMRKIEKDVIDSLDKGKNKGKGAYLSGFAMPHDSPEQLKARGYHMVSGAVDVALFRSAAVEDVKKFKMSKDHSDDEDDDGRSNGGKDDDEKYWSE